mgnify:CR=1 FL=1
MLYLGNFILRKAMKHFYLYLLKILFLPIILVGGVASAYEFHEKASETIAESLSDRPAKDFLKQLYKELYYVPVWIHEDRASSFALELFDAIAQDPLLTDDTKLRTDAVSLMKQSKEIFPNGSFSQKITFEFAMSQLYKGYSDYLFYGSIDWGKFASKLAQLKSSEEIEADWVTYGPKQNQYELIKNAIIQGSLAKSLSKNIPKGYRYQAMVDEILKYRALKAKGGWETIPNGTIKVGQSSSSIPLIRKRLAATQELGDCTLSDSLVYDECLKKAIVDFQKNHRLGADGTIGPQTLKALNMSVDERLALLNLNLERIKRLNHRYENKHIVINIPDFMLTFEENGKVKKEMRVIVGEKKHPTPIFSNRVSYIVLNPYWNIPKSIVQKEMIPKLLKNPKAMANRNIEIRQSWASDAAKVDPATIDWNQYKDAKTVPFRFAQVPGDHNALGRVKFMFPNNFSVYMHDTPTKHLFNRDVRAFSHGCIRLGEPKELLKIFAEIDGGVDHRKSEEVLKTKNETQLGLNNSVPVDIIYLTAWVNHSGKVQWRDDIYGYDAIQLKLMKQW